MSILRLSGFLGENRALHPLNLGDSVGTLSLNQNPARGDLRPWRAPLTVATVPAGRNTIHRMGRDAPSDTNYWLSWTEVVHAVRGFIADDTTERTYYTGDGFPKWTDNTLALASTPYPTAWRQLGVPAPATAPLLTAAGGVSTTMETRYYVYTYVSEKGEESAPSPVSLELNCKSDDVVTITALAAPPAGAYGIDRIRVSRTQADQAGNAEFFFLREIASTASSTTDDNRTLGEVLPTATWLVPPADLHHLTAMWNGMMAGITGNAVRVCEAYKPYAWPMAYEILTPDTKPVALATFGQAMLVLTTGRPVLVTGGTPDSLDGAPVEFAEACVAARSVVSLGHGVAWACPDGLAYCGAGGSKLITAGLMTRDDWQAINPESIVGSMYEGAYLGFYTVGGVTKGFLVDPLNPTGLYFTDIPGSAVFFDELQDQLYLLDGLDIKKWDAGTQLLATFRSKRYRAPKPVNFACAEVVADGYPVSVKVDALGMKAEEVAKLLVEVPQLTAPTATSVRYTVVVADRTPFRLPSGFLASEWQLEISTTDPVQGVAMAQSIRELAEV